MKEVFEKIIERLEDMTGIQFDGNNESYQLDWCIETKRVIEIVNQVAEEYKDRDCSKCSRRSWYQIGYADAEKKYNDDFCEWKNTGISDSWKPSCEPNSTYNVFGVAWFRRCPYCGKKIKAVE